MRTCAGTEVAGRFASPNQALQVEGQAQFLADVGDYAFSFDNNSDAEGAGTITAHGSGLTPVIQAVSDASPTEEVVPPAIHGVSTANGVGVLGTSDNFAVQGESTGGYGVYGNSETGIGGLFGSSSGIGLGVAGRAAFSTVGAGTIPAGQNSVFVADGRVLETSLIFITLVSNPGSRDLRWVQKTPGSGFTVNLSSAPPNARPATAFTYFIVEELEPQGE